MCRTSRGFTLIELLVVILIIAILAAILFPVFARARAKAQQAACLSNVKQITLGILMYVSDNDQYSSLHTNSANQFYFEVIAPCVKNTQIFICPNDPVRPCGTAFNNPPRCCSYGHGIRRMPWNTFAAIDFSTLKYPAEKFIIADGGDWGGFARNDQFVGWHNERSNIGFCDGHAKWMAKTAIPARPTFPTPLATETEEVKFWFGVDPGDPITWN